MARSTKYDRDTALEQAVMLFWGRGYHATSLKQLERALNMRPGSLYAAFGNKQGLFLEALDLYTRRVVEQLQGHLERAPSPLTALQAFIRDFTLGETGTGDEPAQACMLVKTLLEVTDEEELLAERVSELLTEIEEMFEDLLERARREGEIRPDVDPARLARLVQVQLIGLRSFLARRSPRARLEPLVDDICALLDDYRPHH